MSFLAQQMTIKNIDVWSELVPNAHTLGLLHGSARARPQMIREPPGRPVQVFIRQGELNDRKRQRTCHDVECVDNQTLGTSLRV